MLRMRFLYAIAASLVVIALGGVLQRMLPAPEPAPAPVVAAPADAPDDAPDDAPTAPDLTEG